MDETGGRYHVLNRGNYRRWIFEDEGAKAAFEATLIEACARAEWVLHAFCLMGNHYHLALETPTGNLSEGMRWLQSVFAARFNRFRREGGHLFQGRFKSLAVENGERLAWLCHYIHLNPVRAGIVPVEQLSTYRWSSYWYLHEKKHRPACLDLRVCLSGAGKLGDGPAGHRRYNDYLAWLQEDDTARKEMAFERMSRGWAIGSREFKRAVAVEEMGARPAAQLNHTEARAAREMRWEALLEECLQVLAKDSEDVTRDAKSADWKVAVATFLKRRAMASNPWLGRRLNMGAPAGVSRYAGETEAGLRPGAQVALRRLKTKVN